MKNSQVFMYVAIIAVVLIGICMVTKGKYRQVPPIPVRCCRQQNSNECFKVYGAPPCSAHGMIACDPSECNISSQQQQQQYCCMVEPGSGICAPSNTPCQDLGTYYCNPNTCWPN